MKTLIILFSLFLTGCAGTCTHACIFGVIGPGNKLFDAYGNHYNTLDPCQMVGKSEGYKFPSYCFSNAGRNVQYIRDTNNRIIYTVK